MKEPAPKPKKLTKAERRAQQAEFNRQLWQEAYEKTPGPRILLTDTHREAPAAPYYVESRYDAPLQSSLKPAVTLLARKPATTPIPIKDPITGLDKLTLEEEDDENEGDNANQLTLEERTLKAQKEREEKQKRYEQVRERLFGPSNSRPSTPRSSTPPATAKSSERGRGRGRGNVVWEGRESRSDLPVSGRSKQLYDPNFIVKSESTIAQKKDIPETNAESPIIRNPRGPDGSGRGGHGFVGRGNKLE